MNLCFIYMVKDVYSLLVVWKLRCFPESCIVRVVFVFIGPKINLSLNNDCFNDVRFNCIWLFDDRVYVFIIICLHCCVLCRPDGNDEFVNYSRNRLQWYDSNTRRQQSPPAKTSSRHAINYLDQLPSSTVRVRNLPPSDSEQPGANNPAR